MGAAISTQVSKQILTNSYAIANTVVQNCVSGIQQDVTLIAKDNCKQNLGTVNINAGNTINVQCVQNTTVQNSLKAQIQAQVTQQANAAAQSLGGPSLSFAKSLTETSEDIATSITNLFTQNCVANIDQSYTIQCQDSAQQTIQTLNIETGNSVYSTCVNDSTIQNRLQTAMESTIKQTTSAQEADTLAVVIIIVLIFLAIGAIFFIQTLNGPMGWLIVIIVVIVIIGLLVYAAFAFADGLYPFSKPA